MARAKIIFFTTTVILVCSLGFIATDIYQPSLPSLAHYFKDDGFKSILTLSVFMYGMAVSQIAIGILSDRFGRRSVLTLCFFFFSIASLGCFYADNLDSLLIFRFFQGMFASAGLTIGQAMVADTFDEQQTSKILSITVPLIAFSPAVAPLIGAYLDESYGWRANFIVLSAYSLFIICLIHSRWFPQEQSNETKKQPYTSTTGHMFSKENVQKLKQLISIKNIKHKMDGKMLRLLGYLIFAMNSNAIYFTFVSGSPLYLSQSGASAITIGLSVCIASVPYMISSFIGNYLRKTMAVSTILFTGLILGGLGGLLLVLFGHLNLIGFWPLLIPTLFTTFGNGLLMPISASGALSLYPHHTGLVSGILGTAQLVAAGTATYLVSLLQNGTLLPLGYQTMGIACLAAAYFLCVFKKAFILLPSIKNSSFTS
ncbi:MAG: Bcr/CflA family efflux MFS transporter [Silvanigrellaceae bacterium]|nr:Bcr/CflA family efflux MFS transporter [Silvanigrellaceae bacterium]